MRREEGGFRYQNAREETDKTKVLTREEAEGKTIPQWTIEPKMFHRNRSAIPWDADFQKHVMRLTRPSSVFPHHANFHKLVSQTLG